MLNHIKIGQNKTKVGLKVTLSPSYILPSASQNKTKVGLKDKVKILVVAVSLYVRIRLR